MDIDSLPSNSNKSKQEAGTDVQRPKVTAGKVKKAPQSRLKRFTNLFFAEDLGEVKRSIVVDVVVPTVVDMIVNVIKNSAEMLFYGSTSSKSRQGKPQGSYISYNSFAQQGQKRAKPSNTFSFDELLFDTRDDAEAVRDTLLDIVDRYGRVTVLDYYDAAGVTGNGHTDQNYGWEDLRASRVRRTREGWTIEMPKVIPLD